MTKICSDTSEVARSFGLDPANIPQHVAIIMDGNGRWAQQRGKLRNAGHQEGAERVKDILEAVQKLGIKVLTLYAFSEENWRRPPKEVSFLMNLLHRYLAKNAQELIDKNVRLQAIGNLDRLPGRVRSLLQKLVKDTAENTGPMLIFALSYGARSEFVDVVKRMGAKFQSGEVDAETLTEKMVGDEFYLAEFPSVDLLIRTSGELRLSNFLLWDLAYAELFFTKTYWPDFRESEFVDAIRDYQLRERRYGVVKETTPLSAPDHGADARI